jgi:hypothetical protein
VKTGKEERQAFYEGLDRQDEHNNQLNSTNQQQLVGSDQSNDMSPTE